MRFKRFIKEQEKLAKNREIGTNTHVRSLKNDTPGEIIKEAVNPFHNTYGGSKSSSIRARTDATWAKSNDREKKIQRHLSKHKDQYEYRPRTPGKAHHGYEWYHKKTGESIHKHLKENVPTTSTPGIAAIGGPNDTGEPGMSKKNQRRWVNVNKRLRDEAKSKTKRVPSFANFAKVVNQMGEEKVNEARPTSPEVRKRLDVMDKMYDERKKEFEKRDRSRKTGEVNELSQDKLQKYALKAGQAFSHHHRQMNDAGSAEERKYGTKMKQRRRKGIARAYDKMDAGENRRPEKPVRVPASNK